MNINQLRSVGVGAFFLLIFLSGFWLSRTGRPHNTVVFNIHKLIGLAAGIFLIFIVYQAKKSFSLSPIQVTAILFTILIFIINVAAGGLVGIDGTGGLSNLSQGIRSVFQITHRVLPYLAVLSTGMTLYLLLF
jgi:hypothetical protein